MRFACWLTKATDTHSEYAVLTAFPQQQWLRERASTLRLRTLPPLFFLKNFELVLHVAVVQYSALWNWTCTVAAKQFVLSWHWEESFLLSWYGVLFLPVRSSLD